MQPIHALPIDPRLKHDQTWSKLNFRAAAEQSILPNHLIPQIDGFIAKLDKFDRCFVNGDMVGTHIFTGNGQLTGIIDWGDATVTDRHYELGLALYRQAVGLTQHHTFDVFYKLPNIIPLNDIASLEELADILYNV